MKNLCRARTVAAAALTLAFGAAAADPYVVIGTSNNLPATLSNTVTNRGGTVVGGIPQIGLAFVESSDPEFSANMARVAGVSAVIPDETLFFDVPSSRTGPAAHDSLTGAGIFDFLTWGIDAVGAPNAWAAGNRGAGVRVAVLDTGIDADHPDLAPNLNASLSTSFMPCLNPSDPMVYNCDGAVEDWMVRPGSFFNHGSHVAGTIAAAGALGVTGVAPEAEIVAVKVCTEFFNACNLSAIASGIVYAADIDADLVNMSLGALGSLQNDFVKFCKDELELPPAECGRLARTVVTGHGDIIELVLTVFARAFNYAWANGTTVVVSNGNAGLNADTSKDLRFGFADYPNTIGVSALGPLGWCLDPTTSVDEQAHYTNYGYSITDVAAPGGDFDGVLIGAPYTDPCTLGFLTRPAFVFDMVFSTIAGGWGWASGTSMAAPHATGVAALLISANGSKMSPGQVEQALKATAHDLGKPGNDAVYGAGRVWSGY